MNKLSIAAAALFLASTAAAHAGGSSISFQIEGQKIHIQAPKNCASLNCVTIMAPGLSDKPITLKNIDLKGFGSKDDDDVASNSTTTPAPAPVAPQPAPQTQVQAPAPVAPTVTAPAAPSTTVAAAAPGVGFDTNTTTAPAPVAPPAPVAAPAVTAPAPVAVAPAPVAAPTTPLGVWATEENKGNVRVEQCGANLCGFAEKTNEKILINMRPDGAKWTGRIHDPDSGRNYDSTIAMKGPNALRVQGCAFGGMFCGGQTWKRVS